MNERFEEKKISGQWLGRELSFRTGKIAQQANGSVLTQYGETIVLATIVEAKEEKPVDFFPLSVEFEERLYAAGIIKGSRWIKREGRPSDDSILNGRMIDRSIRPLFVGETRKETQVVLTILSVDGENNYDIVAMIAASAALTISGIEWAGPLGGIRVAYVDNQYIFNPTYAQMATSTMDLVLAGTDKKS